MVKKLKVIITTTLVYEPNPENYSGGLNSLINPLPTIEEMRKMDLEGLNDDCSWVSEDPSSDTTIDIVVVEE